MDTLNYFTLCILMALKTEAMMMQGMQNNQNIPPGYQNMPPNYPSMSSNIPDMPPGMLSMPPNIPGMPPNMGGMGPMSSMSSLTGGMPSLSAMNSMLPGYPCDNREVPCQGDLVCRMVKSNCYRPPCPPPVALCVEPPPSTGASCQLGAPILNPDRMTEMRCGAAGGQCPPKTSCTIDTADNMYVCCWNENKPGQCPPATGPGHCAQLCVEDGVCPGDQKCCYNGCGRTCMNPAPAFFGGNFPGLNQMPGFPPTPPANTLEAMMRQNGQMSQMPNPFSMPSGNTMSFPNTASGTTMFPISVSGGQSGFQRDMSQGSSAGGSGYPNVDVSQFSTNMQNQFSTGRQSMFYNGPPKGSGAGSKTMFPPGPQNGFTAGGPNSFQQRNGLMFPSDSQSLRYQPDPFNGFPNNTQMEFPGSQQINFPGDFFAGLHQGLKNPSMPGQWPLHGLPNGFPSSAGPSMNINSRFPQSSQAGPQNGPPIPSTQPKLLIPEGAFDKHTVLQNALKNIVPSVDMPVQPTTKPDGQNTSTTTEGSGASVWNPLANNSAINMTDTSAPNQTNAADILSAGTDTSAQTPFTDNTPPSSFQSGVQTNPDLLFPPNTGPLNQNSQNQFPNPDGQFLGQQTDFLPQQPNDYLNQPTNPDTTSIQNQPQNQLPPGFPNQPQNQLPPGFPNQPQNQSPSGFPNQPQDQSPSGFLNQQLNQPTAAPFGQKQDQGPKFGMCPSVYAVGKCQDTCQVDSDCLVLYKCCSIGPCKSCMHPRVQSSDCPFQLKMRGLC